MDTFVSDPLVYRHRGARLFAWREPTFPARFVRFGGVLDSPKTAILDADVTGPSIPKCFGMHEKAQGCEDGLFPVNTKSGIEVMSINLLLEDETSPVVWRGPVIAGAVKQFWTDVIWGDVDYLFVDMPPGTGDVPLTVFQSLPVDGIVVVTTPQDLVSMIVTKPSRWRR